MHVSLDMTIGKVKNDLQPSFTYFVLSFFMKNIERCVEHPEEIGPVFQRSEKRLQIYVKYCQNKPTSEYIVSEYSNYFEVSIHVFLPFL